MIPDIFRILPEVVLTVTGVIIMLLDAAMAPASSRRWLGWVGTFGVTAALVTSLWQLAFPDGSAFSGTVQSDAFSVFFHVLICGIVIVALLLSLDALPANQHHRGEYFALMVFGTVGMCLMTSAVELLVVFIALEISSISTYILAGYRKNIGKSPEAAIKYFLLGSFATGFLLYGVALIFGATGTTQINDIAGKIPQASSSLVLAAFAMLMVGVLFKVSAAPFHVWTPDVYEGAPSPVVALMSTAPKAAAFALLIRLLYTSFPMLMPLWHPLMWIVAVLSMTVGNLAALRQENVKRMLAYSSIAHAGYLLAAFAGLGWNGIAAASFLHRCLFRHERRHLCRSHRSQRLRRETSAHRRLPRTDLSGADSGYADDLLPNIADRHSLHRRLLRQVLLLLDSLAGGRRLAWPHRPSQLRSGCRVLLETGSFRSSTARGNFQITGPTRNPSESGVAAVGAALAFSAVATLILGIAPTRVLTSAQAAAASIGRTAGKNVATGDRSTAGIRSDVSTSER